MSERKSAGSHERHLPEAFQGRLEPSYYCRAWNEKRQKYCRARAGSGTDHVGTGRCRHHKGNAPIKTGRYSSITRPRIRELLDEFDADPQPMNLEPEVKLLRALLTDWVERYDQLTDAVLAWHQSYGPAYEEAVKDWQKAYGAWRERMTDIYESGWQDTPEDELPQPPEPPDPLYHMNKPRQMLDITAAAGLVDKVGRMVERIEKIRSEGTITLETLDRVLEQLGVEVVKAAREEVADGASRAALLKAVERRWASIRVDTPARQGTQSRDRVVN